MRRAGGEVEASALAGKNDVLRAHGDEQTVHVAELKRLAVDGDGAGGGSNVDDRDLAALEERVAGRRGGLSLVGKPNVARTDDHPANHETVGVGVIQHALAF